MYSFERVKADADRLFDCTKCGVAIVIMGIFFDPLIVMTAAAIGFLFSLYHMIASTK